MTARGRLFVISGPSGSGKTTLVKRLLKRASLGLKKNISYTTRKIRPGEQGERDYIFLSRSGFLRLRKKGYFFEWIRYLGQYYATSRAQIRGAVAKGEGLLLCLDIKGARRLKREFPRSTTTVFILPPDHSTLGQRLRGRSTEGRREVAARMRLARQEMRLSKEYDYVVVNDRLNRALRVIGSLIKKEWSRKQGGKEKNIK